jgi:menaquinone-dependent protoporphyrinogen IX oxidase
LRIRLNMSASRGPYGSGALNYSKLDHADRMAMKAAGAREGDFRDWSAIDNWTDAIVADLA